jgi:hypothetical protein
MEIGRLILPKVDSIGLNEQELFVLAAHLEGMRWLGFPRGCFLSWQNEGLWFAVRQVPTRALQRHPWGCHASLL